MKEQVKDLVQNTEEWLEFRKHSRGASETPIVMGLSPFTTIQKFKKIKLGLENQFYSQAMRDGHTYEDRARELAGEYFDSIFINQVWKNGEYSASLDGISFGGDVLIEIKTSKTTKEDIENGIIPPVYYMQIQQQLFCSYADVGYLVAYDKELDTISVSEPITLDHDFKRKADEAWKRFEELELDTTIEMNENNEFMKAAEAYYNTKKEVDRLNDELKELKAELELIADGDNASCDYLTLSYQTRRGTIDYKKIVSDNKIEFEEDKYKKPDTVLSSVRLKKNAN